jgi:hypothetical protein
VWSLGGEDLDLAIGQVCFSPTGKQFLCDRRVIYNVYHRDRLCSALCTCELVSVSEWNHMLCSRIGLSHAARGFTFVRVGVGADAVRTGCDIVEGKGLHDPAPDSRSRLGESHVLCHGTLCGSALIEVYFDPICIDTQFHR